jgi:hypothetical protein
MYDDECGDLVPLSWIEVQANFVELNSFMEPPPGAIIRGAKVSKLILW